MPSIVHRCPAVLVALSAGVALGMTSDAVAQSFFAINNQTDELVVLDADGAVGVVGPLGVDVRAADLALQGRVVVAAVRVEGADNDELLTIDIDTGAVTAQLGFTLDGNPIGRVESIATDPATGDLYVGYAAAAGVFSTSLGQLSLDGVITPVAETDPQLYLDGLVAIAGGPAFVAVDNDPGDALVRFRALDAGGAVTTIGDVPYGPMASSIDDIAVAGGKIWGLDLSAGRLVSFDPDTADVLSSITEPRLAALRGLVNATPIVCPIDLDEDGELTVFDFLAFQNLFSAGDPIADFDGDGALTLFDFLAFQNAFAAGCP